MTISTIISLVALIVSICTYRKSHVNSFRVLGVRLTERHYDFSTHQSPHIIIETTIQNTGPPIQDFAAHLVANDDTRPGILSVPLVRVDPKPDSTVLDKGEFATYTFDCPPVPEPFDRAFREFPVRDSRLEFRINGYTIWQRNVCGHLARAKALLKRLVYAK